MKNPFYRENLIFHFFYYKCKNTLLLPAKEVLIMFKVKWLRGMKMEKKLL